MPRVDVSAPRALLGAVRKKFADPQVAWPRYERKEEARPKGEPKENRFNGQSGGKGRAQRTKRGQSLGKGGQNHPLLSWKNRIKAGWPAKSCGSSRPISGQAGPAGNRHGGKLRPNEKLEKPSDNFSGFGK